MYRLIALSGVAILGLSACGPSADDPWLRDVQGRAVLYHGVNVSNSSKTAPDFLPWQTQEDCARLKEWGFNLVRFLVFWEAIEPEDGRFDDAYIDRLLERFAWFDASGIDVLVDIHQDVYARRFTGNGFPEWTIHDGGYPFTSHDPWNLNYFEPAVLVSYNHFWHDTVLQGRYVAMVDHLLARIDGVSNVIGLDMMNEPWPWLDFGFERNALTPFYDRIQAMKHDKGYRVPLYFEAVIYTSTGAPARLSFQPETGDVYSVHYYDPFCHEGRAYHAWNRWLMDAAIRVKAGESRRFGTPMMYTEFGIAPNTGHFGDYLDDFIDRLDAYHTGWTYYTYDKQDADGFGILDAAGNPNPILPHLVRAYPQRIAGTDIHYTRETRAFDLQYTPNDSAGPTVLFVPGDLSGACILVNGAVAAFDPGERYFSHTARTADGRQHIRVTW